MLSTIRALAIAGIVFAGGVAWVGWKASIAPPHAMTVDRSTVVLERLRQERELVVAVVPASATVTVSQDESLLGATLAGTEVTYQGVGEIRLGLSDLSQISRSLDGTIELPPIEILSVDLDLEKSGFLTTQQSWLSDFRNREMSGLLATAQTEALTSISQRCQQSDIDQAESLAIATVQSLFSQAGVSAPNVTIRPAAELCH